MGRQKSENRIRAKELWLNSKKKRKLKDIAEEIGVSESLVGKWKSIDKWNEEPLPKRVGVNGKIGCPKGKNLGNKNAVGSKGGKAPKGNKNAVKTGLYETILFSTLSEEEKLLIDQVKSDRIKNLEDEISILTVREYRILKKIEEAKKQKLAIKSVTTRKAKDSFGDIKSEETITNTVSDFEILMALEDALNKVQDRKIKCIDILCKVELELEKLELEKDGGEEDANSIQQWIEATQISTEDISSLFVEGEIVEGDADGKEKV